MCTGMSDSAILDVVVVGGGPVGLSSAYQCAVKRGKTVAVIEQNSFGNEYGSSPGFSRQWRTCYAEHHFCALAVLTSPLWDQLMHELRDDKLLSRTGVLWFGDRDVHTPEGNIPEAKENLDKLGQPYTYLKTKEEISEKFPFIAAAVNDVDNPVGIFVEDGGTINVPALINAFLEVLNSSPLCVLMENTCVNMIDHTKETVEVTTNTGKLLKCKKVILAPGAYVNTTLATLFPRFGKIMKYKIYLWSSSYFQLKTSGSSDVSPNEWPVWISFLKPQPPSAGGSVDYGSYYGFPSSQLFLPCKARVAPAFTSKEKFDFMYFPPLNDCREVDEDAIKYTSSFVENSMPALNTSPEDQTTCIAGFAEMVNEHAKDDGAGFVLDFVPGTNKCIVLATGGWCMKFVPIFGVILSDLAIDGKTNFVYSTYIKPMNIDRGILHILPIPKEVGSVKSTMEQRATKFLRIWS